MATLMAMIICISFALYLALTVLQEPTIPNRLLTAVIAIVLPLSTWGLWRINPEFALLFFVMVVGILSWEAWRLTRRSSGNGRHRSPAARQDGR